jgi:SAM-dependent methyltransferase
MTFGPTEASLEVQALDGHGRFRNSGFKGESGFAKHRVASGSMNGMLISPRWLEPGPVPHGRLNCVNCFASIVPRPVLEAAAPENRTLVLLACDECGAHFFEGLLAGDYGGEPPGAGAALAFYLQQGADIGGMAERLSGLGRPPGTRYLEVGCGFGLGLDFARRRLGWTVKGLDPSPFAATGRVLLDLPIAPQYLRPDEPPEEYFDVVHASEVLEHVPDPAGLLRTLRGALRPDGTLLLTTPAAEAIVPTTSPGLLVPLLSAGWHMVIQTASSLELLLRRAGFDSVDVERSGAQLVARAGAAPSAKDSGRAEYIAWLAAAAAAVPSRSDLGLGLRARLFRERSSAGNHEAAALAWQDLDDAVAARFGACLARWCDESPHALSLAEMVEREPLCLAGVLLHQGIEARRKGEAAEPWLNGAASASMRLRAALRAIGSEDGDAEDVGFGATAQLIECAALRGDPGIASRIAALREEGGTRHAEAAARHCFVSLVNAGSLNEARKLEAVVAPAWAALTDERALAHEDCSLIFCGAVLELQDPEGDRETAVARLQALMEALPSRAPASAEILLAPAVEAAALGLRLLERPAAAQSLMKRMSALRSVR